MPAATTPAVHDPGASSPPNSSREIGSGSVLAERFRIDELIGKGSASEVYLAEQVFLRRKVAVKVLHADHPNLAELADRFEREAMVAAGIENPNIAGALELGRLADGSMFFVVEYVPGKSLRAELASGPLSLERSLHIAKQVASVLADTHEVGIIHHDLKPENLMLLRRGDDQDFVKVLDFGLPHATLATKLGDKAELVLGTPGYISPEQALGQPVDGRADLYSLGVVLFEMVAGVRLFEGSSGILAKQLAGHVPTFAERAPGIHVSPELDKLIGRLLAPGVADRFPSADDVLESLTALSTGARASAPPPAPRPASEKPAARVSPLPPAPAVRSSAPPPMLRRTQSGPPMATDRVPPFEPPPPAKVPHAAGVDDSNVPTTLALPKVSALPPLAPLPSVSAGTAPPPAKPLKPAERLGAAASTSASTGPALGSARTRAAQLVSQARSYAGPLRTQLKGKRKQIVGGALAAGLGISLLAFFAFRSPRPHAPSDLRVATNAATPSVSAHGAAAAAPRELVPGKSARAPLAAASGFDEAAVFLALASDYVRDHREVEAVALVSRLLARQPELKDDPRIASVLSKTVRAEAAQAADESLGLLTGVMGEKGAELMYALSLETSLRDSVRRRVDTWLASKDFDKVSSAALYSAVKLRSAKTCDQKHALLSLAADVGGKQTLEFLRELDARTICGASDLKNCYPCLASDSRLKDSIQRVEKRLAP